MGWFYERLLRPILFLQDPEKAHEYAVLSLRTLGRLTPICRFMERCNQRQSSVPISLFGLQFPNAVGLAAGMDKNAHFWHAAGALGFGHVEIGTVTRLRQPGNPRPRIFRYPEQQAIINRMGFNNDGAEAIARRLESAGNAKKRRIILGINIGKSRAVPLDEAAADYLGSFQLLADYADYIAINVSSPNTPELRRLQGEEFLPNLLETLRGANLDRAQKLGVKLIPLLVKISPDLSFQEIDDILTTVIDNEIDGIIATNTTLARPVPFSTVEEEGGLSGAPLHVRSLEIINYIYRSTEGKLPIIGVGGIDGPETAARTIDAGATLVQIYTGMIYKGPLLAARIACHETLFRSSCAEGFCLRMDASRSTHGQASKRCAAPRRRGKRAWARFAADLW